MLTTICGQYPHTELVELGTWLLYTAAALGLSLTPGQTVCSHSPMEPSTE